MSLNIAKIRADFPILSRQVHGCPLVFLDSAASAQKPHPVLETMREFQETEYANIHRGAYWLSQVATERFEAARGKARAFLNAAKDKEIIFTRNATESINLIAASYGRAFLFAGDEVVITELEHHSNIVPWQMLRDEKGIVLKVVPVTDAGEVTVEDFAATLSPKTKLAAFAHVSNALGTILPVKEMTKLAHERGAVVLVDGCQAAPHLPVDVQDIDCDFYAFSGHKVYGPTGIGVLYGREALLKAMPPYQGGGDMISSVSFAKTTWAPLPAKFEAGTPAIAQAVGLGAALDYLSALGWNDVLAHEHDLLAYATDKLMGVEGLSIVGQARDKISVVSFTLDCAHPHDMATILDRSGVAVRAGHHCAQPLMDRFGVAATARASFYLYNDESDLEAMARALKRTLEFFKVSPKAAVR